MSKPAIQLLKPSPQDKFAAAEDFSLEMQTEDNLPVAREPKAKQGQVTESETPAKAHRSSRKAPLAQEVGKGSPDEEGGLKTKTMRINADVPIELYKKVKMTAWERGITVKELMIELIEQHL